MSVAFRREGDDDHKEPRFEIPIPPGPNWVTPQGLKQIKMKVAVLEAAPRGVDTPAEPDPVQRELRYWRNRLATAELAAAPKEGRIGIGSKVDVTLNQQPRSISIVGDDEADPAANLLSFHAPLSRALIDAEVGDVLDFNGRAGAIEIVSIG